MLDFTENSALYTHN